VLTHEKHIDMESTPNVNYNELTLAEQTVVANATGWNGTEYHDVKSGIKIALVDGDVATYRVLEKGDQTIIEAQPIVEAEPVVVAPTQTPDTSETQTNTEPTAPTEPEAPVTPSDVPPATEPQA
jgi:hypothetical protein